MFRWPSAALLAVALVAVPALAQVPQQKLAATLSKLQQSKRSEAALQDQLEAASGDLETMRRRATALAGNLQKSEERANHAERELAALNERLRDKEIEFSARRREYGHTIASLLRMRSLPPTAMFAQPERATELLRTGRVMKNVNEALAERAFALREDVERLTRLRQQVARQKENVGREQTLLDEKQRQLAADLATRQRLQRQLAHEHADASREISRLSRESNSLQELIGKLERGRPQWASKPVLPSKRTTARAPARGQLKLPVVGQLLHSFGERKNANETYRGLVLSARPNATVIAPADGEVVFTGPFMDYGRMVLLKHGDSYISLLAGLGSISVGLNQQLARGEPIGSMGGGAPKLYLELRERSKPIDPARWFANLPPSLASR